MSGTDPSLLVRTARDLAQVLLRDLPPRWRHTIAVARRADELTATVDGDDPDVLVAAAWLHDIGYADALTDTGFHPLDGARHLDKLGWSPRITALVAHHSGAGFVAQARGLQPQLNEYPLEQSAMSDALTYADQTVDPTGQRTTVAQRMADTLLRDGPNSSHAAARGLREPYLLALADRVEHRLARVKPQAKGAVA